MVQAPVQASVGKAIYVYCFSLPDIPAPAGPGVDESQPIQVHTLGGLSAVAGWVALDDFTGVSGEANLQDIAWLGPRACRHAVVVEQVMAAAPVFPLPFGTLFSSLSALEQEIGRRSSEVASLLEQVAGCEEWSVEVTLDRLKSMDYLLSEGLQSGLFKLPDSAGRRHLEEKKLRRQVASDLDGWVDERMESLQQELMPLARDFRTRRLTENKISHWAYLVPVGQVPSFRVKVDYIAAREEEYGLAFRVSGPWPPYTFCQTMQ
jgi:hypothetical protein